MTAVPGTRLLAFASRWFDAPTVSRVFEPLVADWQREWIESPALARAWVVVRGSAAFMCAVLWSTPWILATPAPPAVMRRVVMKIAIFVGVGCALLSVPLYLAAPSGALVIVLFLTTLPGIAASLLPFAMVAAVDAIRCHEALPDHVERAAVIKVGLVTVTLVLLSTGWLNPALLREWRAMSGGEATSAGLTELSIVDLLTHPARHEEPRMFTISGTVRRELANRASLVVLPIVLIWLRWRMLDLPRRRWISPLPASLVVVLTLAAFVMTRAAQFSLDVTLGLSPGTGMWMLMAIFPLGGLALQWAARLPKRR